MSFLGAYQSSSPWPHLRGQYNNHTGLSPYIGSPTNKLKWKFDTGGHLTSSATIASDGTIYIGSDGGSIFAFTPTGSVRWKYSLDGADSSGSIGTDGTIYIGTFNSGLLAFSPLGTTLWTFPVAFSINSSPAVSSNGSLHFGATNSIFYSISNLGSLQWSYTAGGIIDSSPAIGTDGSIYVGSFDNKLYSWTPTGTLKWSYITGNTIAGSPTLSVDGSVYVGSFDFNFYSFSSTGTLKWKHATGSTIYGSAGIGPDGTIYIGSEDYYVYAFSNYGTVKWKFTTGIIYASPTIGANGVIYIGSNDYNLYAISTLGSLLWKYATGNTFYGSPAIGSDGTIYIGSQDYSVYAISGATASKIPTRIPTFKPTTEPSIVPTFVPTFSPSTRPSYEPTLSIKPTVNPTTIPKRNPTSSPSVIPTTSPLTIPSINPARYPTLLPSLLPTVVSTTQPSVVSSSASPSNAPVLPTTAPSISPSLMSSNTPTVIPSEHPSIQPLNTLSPSISSTINPSVTPSTQCPIVTPTVIPSERPSPLIPSVSPSYAPSMNPSACPTNAPSDCPSAGPIKKPSVFPSSTPIMSTSFPSHAPSTSPSIDPTTVPSHHPSCHPLNIPTTEPTAPPTKGSGSTSNSASNTQQSTIITAVSVVGGFTIIGLITFVCCFYYLKSISSKKDSTTVLPKGNVELHHLYDGFGNPGAALNLAGDRQSRASKTNQLPKPKLSASQLVEIMQIPWLELNLNSLDGQEGSMIIGEGSYGYVLQGIWRPKSKASKNAGFMSNVPKDVAIKVLKLSQQDSKGPAFDAAVHLVKQEATVMRDAERLVFSDCIAKVYGMVQGQVPENIAKMLGIRSGVNCVGIVLRYEAGGDLFRYLHGNTNRQLTLVQKLHLLTGIASGITELHGAGIIHGDIKPENILLSSDADPEVRLSDFGLAFIREESNNTASRIFQSSLKHTLNDHARGTPIYSAPEMLFNPLDMNEHAVVAKSSRKTDVYAFSILAWEVMSQQQPFNGIKTKEQLCWSVHQNVRPSLDELPSYTPSQVTGMILSCWSKLRSRRMLSSQCFSIVSWHHQQLTQATFDIFLSHSHVSKPFLSFIYKELSKCGYRVWFDQHQQDNSAPMIGIRDSKIFLACVDSIYQDLDRSMAELEEARSMTGKTVITLVVEESPFFWASARLRDLCGFSSSLFVDVSGSAKLDWESENGATPFALDQLRRNMGPLIRLLDENGCKPVYTSKVKTASELDAVRVSTATAQNALIDL